jgi:hypothetical protein
MTFKPLEVIENFKSYVWEKKSLRYTIVLPRSDFDMWRPFRVPRTENTIDL